MTEPARAIAYLRQSEERPGEDARTSLSLRSQEAAFRAWCERTGAVALGVVADHDLRGHDAARPGIRDLLDLAERERADTVWVLSLSRFARDHILQELVWRDLQARGVRQLVSEIESGTDDPFVRGIYGLMHAKSRTEMSAHLKGAFARRARDGGFPTGPTPLGYRRPYRVTIHRANGTSYQRETGEPEIDPEGAALVRELAERVLAGESLAAIADDLNARGPGTRGGMWRTTTIRRMLRSPIYAGDIAHHGVVVAHNDRWAILDRETWDRLQLRFERAPVIRRGAVDSWLEGHVRHACGRRMYYQAYTGRSAGHGGSLICQGQWERTCRDDRRIVGARLLESAVRRLLEADLGALRVPAEAVRIAQAEAGGADATARRRALDRREAEARARWRRNHERFSSGRLPPDVMDAEDERLDAALAQIAADRAALPAPPDPDAIARAHASLTAVRDMLPTRTGDELRGLLADLGAVVVGADGVRIAYHAELAPLLAPSTLPLPRWGRGLRSVG